MYSFKFEYLPCMSTYGAPWYANGCSVFQWHMFANDKVIKMTNWSIDVSTAGICCADQVNKESVIL